MNPSSVDVLGLDGTFPRPGWVVLDAARERAFTGELEFETSPPVCVYCDRGRIYLAERTTDPPLGARLVDAGALDAVQLDHGTIRIGDVDHIGRLFERSPSVDRQTVMVVLELMTEEATTWVAAQSVRGVRVTPYRHHPSGVHRWDRSRSVFLEALPGSPLPAPDPTDLPTFEPPPPPVSRVFAPVDELDGDVRIVWDEPTFVDRTRPAATGETGPGSAGHSGGTVERADVLRDERDEGDEGDDGAGSGEGDGGTVASASVVGSIAPDPMTVDVLIASDPLDSFEVIWPSGEVDEEFGDDGLPPVLPAQAPAPADADDRVATEAPATAPADAPSAPGEVRFTMPMPSLTAEEVALVEAHRAAPVADEVVLAVRRAIAAIETGFVTGTWPAGLPDDGSPDPLDHDAPELPLSNGSGRTQIVPSVGSGRSPRPVPGVLAGYDESPETNWADEAPIVDRTEVVAGSPWRVPAPTAPSTTSAVAPGPSSASVGSAGSATDRATGTTVTATSTATTERTSALRRLIAGLRRR